MDEPHTSNASASPGQLGIWEVFVQEISGSPHEHVGSVHANDVEMALQNARDVYARRGKVSNLWVVPHESVFATTVHENDAFFESQGNKPYRYPQFYKTPRGVKNL